jgi:hypothetical protein
VESLCVGERPAAEFCSRRKPGSLTEGAKGISGAAPQRHGATECAPIGHPERRRGICFFHRSRVADNSLTHCSLFPLHFMSSRSERGTCFCGGHRPACRRPAAADRMGHCRSASSPAHAPVKKSRPLFSFEPPIMGSQARDVTLEKP